jgi:hypothetical protein
MIKSSQFGIHSVARLMATSIVLGVFAFAGSRGNAACGDYIITFDLQEIAGATTGPSKFFATPARGPMRSHVPCTGPLCKSNQPRPTAPLTPTTTLVKQYASCPSQFSLTAHAFASVEMASAGGWQSTAASPPDPPPRACYS